MQKSKLVCLLLLQIIVLSCKKSDNKNTIIKTNKEVTDDTKLNDTLVVLDDSTIVFFSPNDKEIEELKKKHGEDDFYTIADDVMGYLANITEELDLRKIKYITTESKVVNFKNSGLFINKDDLKSKWSILYFDKNKTLKKVSPIDFYMNEIVAKETPIAEKFLGEFEVGTEGEYTNEGTGHTTYYFTITKNGIVLKSEAFRGDFLCEGNYKGVEKDSILEVYYNENDERCKQTKPNYLIKKDKEEYFIKHVGGEATFNEWVKLDKK